MSLRLDKLEVDRTQKDVSMLGKYQHTESRSEAIVCNRGRHGSVQAVLSITSLTWPFNLSKIGSHY